MPDTLTPSAFPLVTKLDLGINTLEDRLVLVAHTREHGRRLVLLTRRMVGVLLAPYGRLLEQTSRAASRVPADHLQEVLQMEHVGALSRLPGPADGTGPRADADADAAGAGGDGVGDDDRGGAAVPDVAFLVTEIKLQAAPEHLVIGFLGQRRHGPQGDGTAQEPVCAMTLDRADAHRVLAMVSDKAREADWALPPPASWLTAPLAAVGEGRPAN